MTLPPAPARLTAILAEEASVGVIFRHESRTTIRMIRWDTNRDTFEPGQWLTGEIATRSLSPDGTKLVYHASKFPGQERKRYTAISRPPYFTAVAYWPWESGWGWAAFLRSDKLRLWYWTESQPPSLPDETLQRWLDVDARPSRAEVPLTDRVEGWRRAGVAPGVPQPLSGARAFALAAWSWGAWAKPHPEGHGELRRCPASSSPRGVARRMPNVVYDFTGARGGPTDLLQGATWADWDRRGRLVFARDGKLFAADAKNPAAGPEELADFNAIKPESIKAPEWATRWSAKPTGT